jgi:enamine deaminase RidA (YjgF/YER057c/UK114 family)
MTKTVDPASARGRGTEHVHANLQDMYNQFHFCSAFEVDGWVYLSGVIASPQPGEADLIPAYERAFKEIGEVLASAGVSWDGVVKITSYHKDVMAEAPAMCAVKDRVMPPPYPAWTAINIASLADPNGVTEIDITARKR